jgi:hypothetical protein
LKPRGMRCGEIRSFGGKHACSKDGSFKKRD